MNTHDETYLNLLKRVLNEGKTKKNRTGIDTIGVFGAQARFDLAEGFPLLTTKKVFFKGIVHELLWFISGSTNIKYLVDNDVHIWDDWAYQRYLKFVSKIVVMGGIDKTTLSQKDFIHRIKTVDEFAKIWGELGTGTYGGMWRAFPFYNDYDTVAPVMEERDALDSVDQLKRVVEKLKSNPDDRRLIVSAWHPYWVEHCALPPCHVLFHFNTEVLPDGHRKLNCLLYQRSCDLFLGVPFNIASYALLLKMVAHCVGMVPGEFIHTYGDLHLYRNHVDQAKLQLTRAPFPSPHVSLNPAKRDLFLFNYDDIQLAGYNSHPAIKADVAV
jgi:thymidylate synthase